MASLLTRSADRPVAIRADPPYCADRLPYAFQAGAERPRQAACYRGGTATATREFGAGHSDELAGGRPIQSRGLRDCRGTGAPGRHEARTSTLPTSSLKPLLREAVQNVVDRLAGAPMVLSVGGQLKQYFQIEYPRWKFRVVGSRIVAEKIGDCNVACAAGSSENKMSLTYSYVGDGDPHQDTLELDFDRARNCRLLLKDGAVFLSDEVEPQFQPPAENGQSEAPPPEFRQPASPDRPGVSA